MVIDTHCHLADAKFAADLPEVLARARSAGVSPMLCIGDSLPESVKCIEIANRYPDVFAVCGVHPHHAKDWTANSVRELEKMSGDPRVKAIGEIGLDYHYDFSPREAQRSAFREQLSFARERGMPVVIHCREAIRDVQRLLQDFPLEQAVLHCCTEKWEDVEALVAGGIHLSFTGIATYPHAEEIRETIRACPLEQMMVETDAPYLAPVPHRGKRNEPAFVIDVARVIAETKELSVQEIDRSTTANAVAFYGLPHVE